MAMAKTSNCQNYMNSQFNMKYEPHELTDVYWTEQNHMVKRHKCHHMWEVKRITRKSIWTCAYI